MRVYFINLDRHTQRLARMRELLRGMDFERVPAVDAATVEGHEHRLKFPLRFEDMTRYERACAASHASAWRQFLESGESHACFLEDDVVLSPEFAGFMADAGWIPDDCDAVKIETFMNRIYIARRPRPCRDRNLAWLYSTHLGAAGYVLSRAGAEKLMAHAARPERPVDHLLFDIPAIVRGFRVLQLDPGLCIQLEQATRGKTEGEFKSSIQTGKAFAEKRKPAEKIIWELTRPWRQLMHFVTHSPLRAMVRIVEFR